MNNVRTKSSRGNVTEVAFLVLIVISLLVLVITVFWPGWHMLCMAWDDLVDFEKAYQSVVVDTLVVPFEALLAAFVVYTFGKLGAKVLDNKTRAKKNKPLHDLSLFGKVPNE